MRRLPGWDIFHDGSTRQNYCEVSIIPFWQSGTACLPGEYVPAHAGNLVKGALHLNFSSVRMK